MYSFNSFKISALEEGGWSASRPGRIYPWETASTHFAGGVLGPRAGLDSCGNLAPPGLEPQTFQPVGSRYTDYATRPAQWP